jgi:hypothetical protein
MILGSDLETVVLDVLQLFLVLFLRSTIASPVWCLGLKWTALVSVPVEALLYGGGARGYLVASFSIFRFVTNYGFVLNWAPVVKRKDTLVNRVIEFLVTAGIFAVVSPWIMQAFFVQLVLTLHAFWLSHCTVEQVCASPAFRDPVVRQNVIEDLGSLPSPGKRIPIEVWLLAYDCAVSRVNNFPGTWVESLGIESSVVPWQLRRLVVRAISVDPTRSQLKALVNIANGEPVVSSVGQSSGSVKTTGGIRSLFVKGPAALISEEPNEKVVINEAVQALTLLMEKLGERRFSVAFDKSADSKLALEIITRGFK